MLNWLIFLLGSAAALAFAYFTYFRREPSGRGRPLLMALRAASLLLLILLLIDPQLGANVRATRNNTRVILDASLSMQPRAADSSAWQRALSTARADGGAGIILAGSAPRSVASDSLNQIQPTANTSRILPALQRAAEAGAGRVVLVTDGAIEDAAEVARWLPRLGIELAVKAVDAPAVANRAIAELNAPAWAEAGKPLQLRVSVAGRGIAPGSNTRIVVKQNGNVVASGDVTVPAEQRLSSTTLSFNASGPPEGGLVRYDVAFEAADSIPDDDVRSAYVFVSEKPAGVAIVSFLPDWEPKFLHPVLGQALGLPVRTFLRVPNGSYFRGGEPLEAGTREEEAAVRRTVAQADLVVLHGVTENAPVWWRDVAANARRLIIFPTDALAAPFEVSAPISSDWYVAAEVPASPIAAFLQNVELGELPPMEAMFTATPPDNAWTPLLGGRTRRGGRAPVLYAYESDGRRVAIALGTGYWRWAFRGGTARDLYHRLWGALAGWIVQDQAQVAGAAIRPVRRIAERGEALGWVAPGLAFDSLRVRVQQNGRVIQSSVVTQLRGDTAVTAPLTPGHYRYVAQAYAGGEQVAEATGPITVESYSAEYLRAPADLSVLRSAPASLSNGERGRGRPLHASPWPYVLLVLLLCTEWILRRRWGLR
jgi:hypothetical protein